MRRVEGQVSKPEVEMNMTGSIKYQVSCNKYQVPKYKVSNMTGSISRSIKDQHGCFFKTNGEGSLCSQPVRCTIHM